MSFKRIQITFLSLSLGIGLLFACTGSSILVPLLMCGAVAFFVLFLKENSFKSLNILVVGLLIGYLMTQLFISILKAIDGFDVFPISNQNLLVVKISIYLFCSYLGIVFVWRTQGQWALAIPFIRFEPMEKKKKAFILDGTVLLDPRFIDLAATGLFDQRLILPRFILQDCKKGIELDSEDERQKNKRALESVQKLEEIPGLDLKIDEHDFYEVKEIQHKLIQLARLLEAPILTADPSSLNARPDESVKWIHLFSLSTTLKPIVQTGETLAIKIQRYGKEPLQGIGYLEDGTMVVVNGGSHYLGETVHIQVLSVKHTPAGRMIFANLAIAKTTDSFKISNLRPKDIPL